MQLSFSDECYITISIPSGWRVVLNRHAVNVDFNTQNLGLKTNTRLGRYEKIRMMFQNKEGKEAGGFFVKFSNPPQYMIAHCTNWKPFPTELSTTVDKIWRFSNLGYSTRF